MAAMSDEQRARWVGIGQAAKALDKSERTIRRMMADARLSVDRKGPVILVDIGPFVVDNRADERQAKSDNVTDTPDTVTGEVDVAALLADNERLRALLEEVRQERDYLRQVHAMALTLTKQLEAPRTERRTWWKFWQADAGQ
jgi:hypothetical protein